jgi:hypothetical protein
MNEEKPHGKFQVPINNVVEKNPRNTVTCICPIVENPRARNSGTIGVTTMKTKLNM